MCWVITPNAITAAQVPLVIRNLSAQKSKVHQSINNQYFEVIIYFCTANRRWLTVERRAKSMGVSYFPIPTDNEVCSAVLHECAQPTSKVKSL